MNSQGEKKNARPYTGPTAISLDQGRIHIDGYPDAKKVVEWRSELGHRLAGLRRHQSALKFCEDAMQEFGAIRGAHPLAAEAALIGIVSRYFSCFGHNQASAPLAPERIFRGMPDARECFEHWKAIRDNHYIHDQSEISTLRTGIVLGQSSEVLDILSLGMGPHLVSDEKLVQLLFDLIVHTQKKVLDQIDDILRRSFVEVRALSVKQLEAFPEIEYTTPDSGAAKRIRTPRRR